MLECDLPSTLPSSPVGPHLRGFRGRSACGFFLNGGKHEVCRQTGQLAPALTERPLPNTLTLRGHRGHPPMSTPTVEGSCQWGDLPPYATCCLCADQSAFPCIDGKRVKVETAGKPQSRGLGSLWMPEKETLRCYCFRKFWMWGRVRMSVAADTVEKWRSDVKSKRGHCVRLLKMRL